MKRQALGGRGARDVLQHSTSMSTFIAHLNHAVILTEDGRVNTLRAYFASFLWSTV